MKDIIKAYKAQGIEDICADHPVNHLAGHHPTFHTIDALKQCFQNLDHPLKKTALNTVIFRGDPQAKIMIIGEAPGEEEDKQGLPFVGKSGQLLDKMLATIGLGKSDVYITNLVPWRPPGNRNPTNEEMNFFLPYLHQHILLKHPEIIVLLGSIAMRALLGDQLRITQIRGRWQTLKIDHHAFPVLASFHPSYLLRSPKQKKLAWYDWLEVKRHVTQQVAESVVRTHETHNS